ncbi:MAG: hypothetical protein IPK87_05120 [Planctomycetes bacterium]|nr:hypothetical protein [Planctomycetota bacterium]
MAKQRNKRRLKPLRRAKVKPLSEQALADFVAVVRGLDQEKLSPRDIPAHLLDKSPPLHQGDIPRSLGPAGLAAAYLCNGFALVASVVTCVGIVLLSGYTIDLSTAGTLPRVMLGALFAIPVIVLLLLGSLRAYRALRMVRLGTLAWSIITSVDVHRRRTTDDAYEEVRYVVRMAYLDHLGALRLGEIELLSASALLDEELELLMFDPRNPSRFQFADLLPGWLRINSAGKASISPVGYALATLCIGVPAILLAAFALA